MIVEDVKAPSKEEQITARESYEKLATALQMLHNETPSIAIAETGEPIKIPLRVLQMMAKILEATGEGKPISVVPIAMEMTTQAAAGLLGCSRPHLIKLLKQGDLPFKLVGRHRRLKFEDVRKYQMEMQAKQKNLLIEMMRSSERLGHYDS